MTRAIDWDVAHSLVTIVVSPRNRIQIVTPAVGAKLVSQAGYSYANAEQTFAGRGICERSQSCQKLVAGLIGTATAPAIGRVPKLKKMQPKPSTAPPAGKHWIKVPGIVGGIVDWADPAQPLLHPIGAPIHTANQIWRTHWILVPTEYVSYHSRAKWVQTQTGAPSETYPEGWTSTHNRSGFFLKAGQGVISDGSVIDLTTGKVISGWGVGGSPTTPAPAGVARVATTKAERSIQVVKALNDSITNAQETVKTEIARLKKLQAQKKKIESSREMKKLRRGRRTTPSGLSRAW